MTGVHLRRRMALEQPARSPDGAGGFVEPWVTLGEVWVEVKAMPGREVTQGGQTLSRNAHRMMSRAAPQGADMRPRPDQRLREGARIFTILAVSDSDPTGRYLTCYTQEEVAP